MFTLRKNIIIIACVACNVSGQDFSEVMTRTWTSSSGQKVNAQLVGMDNGNVILKTSDGKHLRIPFTSLNGDDQVFVKSRTSENDATPAAPIPSSAGIIKSTQEDLLSVLADGFMVIPNEWKTNIKQEKVYTRLPAHSIYQGKLYTACVDSQGTLYIMPKLDHKLEYAFNGAIKFAIENCYRDVNNCWAHRKIKKFINPPAPAMNPADLTIKAVLEDDVATQTDIQFTPDTVTVTTMTTVTRELTSPNFLVASLNVPQSHLLPLTASIDEIRSAVKDCSLFVQADSNPITYDDFSKSVRIHTKCTKVVSQNHWAGRKVTFEVVSGVGTRNDILLWNYPDRALKEGFRVFIDDDRISDKEKKSGEKKSKQKDKGSSKKLLPARVKITFL